MKKRIVFSLISVFLMLCIVFTNAAPVGAYPTSHFLNVPIITQPYSNWCWAASGACVVRYVKGTNTTASEFAYAVQKDYSNSMRSLLEVKTGLTHYSVHSTVYDNTVTVSNNSLTVSALSFSSVANYLWADRPLIAARFPYIINDGNLYVGVGHVVVIEGYSTDDGVNHLSYMDPAYLTMRTTSYASFKKTGTYFWGASLYNIY